MKCKLRQFFLVVILIILAAGCDSNQSQLRLAAWGGKTDTVKALLAGGADVNAKDRLGGNTTPVVF